VLANAFIKDSVANGSAPFKVGWYESDTTVTINYLQASAPGYRGEACQPLDLDLVDLEGKGHFRIRKVQPGYDVVGKMNI
jgi:hypothetical protein